MTALVTGDAVAFELRPARLPSRALAFLIDLVVMVALAGSALIGILRGLTPDDNLAVAIGTALFIGVFVGYPVLMETLTRGRSLGKMALGLRVVREDGGPIGFRQALARALAGLFVDFYGLSGFTGSIAIVSSLVSHSGRRLGDMLAGTLVVRERMPGHTAVTPEVAPTLAEWAESLETSQLSDTLARHVREFLRRADALDPAQRCMLARDLAVQVREVISPPPPPDTSPEPLLNGVMHARRQRAEARAAALRPIIPAQRQPSEPRIQAGDARRRQDQNAEHKSDRMDATWDGFSF
jgi:uncharacterized RDD family membrane protein YckC